MNDLFEKEIDVTKFAISDLLESDDNKQNNELLEILDFTRINSVPLTDEQVKGMFLLHEFGLKDIAIYVDRIRPKLSPFRFFLRIIEKLTLADRIKGNAKLGNLLKANMGSPSQNLASGDLQPKAMRVKELDR